MSISGLVSAVKVTMPSTSAGAMPASRRAAADGLDGQPQLGAAGVLGELGGADAGDGRVAGEGVVARVAALTTGSRQARVGPTGSATRTVPVTWSPQAVAPRTATSTTPRPVGVDRRPWRSTDAGEASWCRRGSSGRPGGWRPPETAAGPGPVGDVPADQAVGGEDVHEDVLRPPLVGQLGVVVDVLVVAAGEGAGHDQRPGDGHDQSGSSSPTATSSYGAAGRVNGAHRSAPPGAPGPRRSGSAIGAPGRPAGRSGRRAGARSACPRGSSGGSGS